MRRTLFCWLGTFNHGYALAGSALALYIPQWHDLTHTPLYLELLALSLTIELLRYVGRPLLLGVHSERKGNNVANHDEAYQSKSSGARS